MDKILCYFGLHRLNTQNLETDIWHCYCYKAVENTVYPASAYTNKQTTFPHEEKANS